MRKNAKVAFVLRVMLWHVVTYIVCGIVFSTLFDYPALYKVGSTAYFMREYDGVSTLIGPLLQVVRGALFGLVLLLFPAGFFEGKRAWLRLWLVIAVIGILNTPGPAPSSIEGMIYSTIPFEVHLKGSVEILVQTLLFAVLVCKKPKEQGAGRLAAHKGAILAAAIVGFGISLSGIVLCLVLRLDIMAAMGDMGAFAVMFAGIAITFFVTKWAEKAPTRGRLALWLVACWVCAGVLPTVYNYATGSLFRSPLTLIFGLVPAGLALLVARPGKGGKQHKG